MSRFSYKEHCYKLSDQCFQLHTRCRRLEAMVVMASMVAVYSGLNGPEDEAAAKQMVNDLREALHKWADRGCGPPDGELEVLVNKLAGRAP